MRKSKDTGGGSFRGFSEKLLRSGSERKLLKKYFGVFDFLNDGIFIMDKKFGLLYWNSKSEKIFGLKDQELIKGFGKRFENLINTGRTGLMRVLDENGEWRKEVSFRGANGKMVFATVVLNRLKDTEEKKDMIFGICTDTTELNSAIDLLNKRNSLLNLLNDVIKFTSRSTDMKSSVKYAIDKVCQYTQWDIGHCYLVKDSRLVSTKIWNTNLEKKYSDFRNYSETAVCITDKGMPKKCFQTGKLLLADLYNLRKDYPFKRFNLIKNLGLKAGIWVPVMINNKVSGVIEFFSNSDISSDTEILYAMSNIGIELGSHKDRIEIFNDLKNNEKLAALGRFSASIAHELRNPLANISALSQLIQKGETNERNKQYLSFILENIQIADKTIKDLLSDVSPEEISLNAVDFRKFAEKILEKSRARFLKKKVKILKNISYKLPGMFIDEVKMENALLNLLDNAKDSMPAGGLIKFSVQKKSKDNFVTIKIADNGTGISEENMDKIFEPFFTTKSTGTGLGMGLARQAINSHGGTLQIRSRINSGTTIEIKLPSGKE